MGEWKDGSDNKKNLFFLADSVSNKVDKSIMENANRKIIKLNESIRVIKNVLSIIADRLDDEELEEDGYIEIYTDIYNTEMARITVKDNAPQEIFDVVKQCLVDTYGMGKKDQTWDDKIKYSWKFNNSLVHMIAPPERTGCRLEKVIKNVPAKFTPATTETVYKIVCDNNESG